MSSTASKALLILSVLLILFPPMFCRYRKWQIVFKVLSWVLIGFTAITGPLSVYIKDCVFKKVPTSSRVVYDLSFSFLYVTNIYICLNTILRQRKLTKLLESCLDVITESRRFVVHFACIMFLNTVNTVFIVLTQMKRTEDKYYYLSLFMVEGFLVFRVSTALFVIFLLVNKVKEDLKEFNTEIETWCRRSKERVCRWNGWREHSKLCDTVEQINELFGTVLMWTIFYFITNFLRHGVFITTNKVVTGSSVVRCLWICSYGFQACYLAHVGEEISKETKRTQAICYKMMPDHCDHDPHGVGKQLRRLAQQVHNRKIKITASGFFRLDHSMILFMVTTFCTYFIVAMQFLTFTGGNGRKNNGTAFNTCVQ